MKFSTLPDRFTAESSADRGFTWSRFLSMAAILAMVPIAHSMHPHGECQFVCANSGHIEAGTVGTLTVET